MARLFPLRSETPTQEGRPRVVDLDDEDADAVFGALSSTTARRIYATLDEDPATPSDVADAIDSSIQNVRYHLEKLEDAGLVEVVDTWYSSRGNEMSVYATADGPLIVTSDRTRAEQLKDAISRFVGGIAALAGASLLVQYGASRFFGPSTGSEVEPTSADGGSDDGAATGNGNGAETGGGDAAEDADGSGNGGGDAAGNGNGNGNGNGDGGGTEDQAEGDGFTAADAEDTDAGTANETSQSTDSTPAGDGGNATDSTPSDDPATAENVSEAADGAAEAADIVAGGLPPGLLFFLGGLVVLTAVMAYWYWHTY